MFGALNRVTFNNVILLCFISFKGVLYVLNHNFRKGLRELYLARVVWVLDFPLAFRTSHGSQPSQLWDLGKTRSSFGVVFLTPNEMASKIILEF